MLATASSLAAMDRDACASSPDAPREAGEKPEDEAAADRTNDDPSLTALLEQLRSDQRRHGRVLTRSFIALAVYRFGNWAAQQRTPLRGSALRLYGWSDKLTRVLTGVHMDRQVRVGKGFHIIHAEGNISIHPEAVLGDRVGIMHNVTIGTEPNSSGAPRIGNDVFIGVGAVVLGPITIGDRASIAANSLVIADVPPDSLAIGVPARVYPKLSALSRKGVAPAPGSQSGSSR
jgi:serine O-acetyltransferase